MMLNDPILNTILISLVAAVLWIVLTILKTPKNLPPGPMGLPYFGYLPFLGKNPHIVLTQLKKKYGDMLMIYMGRERVIVLGSFDLIKAAYLKQGDNFSESAENYRNVARFDSQEGMFAGYGPPRVEMRRFTLTTLRNFGMGKASLEPKIQDEIHCLIDKIKNLKGKPSYFDKLLTVSVTNVICMIMYGKRKEYDDEDFQQLLQLSKNYVKSMGVNQLSQYLPQFLVKLLKIQTPVDIGTLLYKKIFNELTKIDKDNDEDNPDNFINAWKAEAEKPNSKSEIFNDKKLSVILSELFIAGSDTTSTSIEWALLYLIKYPKIQLKMQQEIDNVIGKDRTPSMSDQKLMPYTEATIMEVNRITSISPLGTPHSTREDTHLHGYFIPKYTTIYTNVWSIHRDPQIFSEPELFKPERFLTDDNKVKNIEELIPFSMGKRQCPGEALARMELFLYLASLLQHFTFTKEDSDVSLDYNYAILLGPLHQKICAISR